MKANVTSFAEHNRVARIVLALTECARVDRFDGVLENLVQVLKASRLDPHVVRETRRIMKELPEGVVAKFLERYRTRDPTDRRIKSKYFNLPVHVAHAVWQGKELGLYDAERAMSVVDLGTGFGYFPLVCDSIGHRSIGLDWDRWKVYESISKDIAIDRREWVVTPEEPLPPDIDAPVDLVTAFRPVFYYEFDSDSLWAEAKWDTFFRRLVPRLSADAKVYIGENRISEGQRPHLRAMVAHFRKIGGMSHQNGWLFGVKDLARLADD